MYISARAAAMVFSSSRGSSFAAYICAASQAICARCESSWQVLRARAPHKVDRSPMPTVHARSVGDSGVVGKCVRRPDLSFDYVSAGSVRGPRRED